MTAKKLTGASCNDNGNGKRALYVLGGVLAFFIGIIFVYSVLFYDADKTWSVLLSVVEGAKFLSKWFLLIALIGVVVSLLSIMAFHLGIDILEYITDKSIKKSEPKTTLPQAIFAGVFITFALWANYMVMFVLSHRMYANLFAV